jgi:hypothetical protein
MTILKQCRATLRERRPHGFDVGADIELRPVREQVGVCACAASRFSCRRSSPGLRAQWLRRRIRSASPV